MGRLPIIVYFVKGNVLAPHPKGVDGEAFPPAIISLKKVVSASRAKTRTAAKKGPFPKGKRLTLQWTGVIDKFYPDPRNTLNSFNQARRYLKNADYVQVQGAGRRKSGAYKVVCEHFEEVRNTVIER
jgi:hypothetical protein